MSAEHYEREYLEHFPHDSWPRALEQARTSRDADAALELLIEMAREHERRERPAWPWSRRWGARLAQVARGPAACQLAPGTRKKLSSLSRRCGGWWEWEWDDDGWGPFVARPGDATAPTFLAGSALR